MSSAPDSDFNQRVVEELSFAALKEQRARRRWSIFFKLILLLYLIIVTVLYLQDKTDSEIPSGGNEHAAVIPIIGTIEAGGKNSAHLINALLRRAFENKNSKGVILEINSPGGSAVESHRIYQEIRRLRQKYPDKSVIAVAGDYCASGGYFIAAAADEIYADPASIIGSIGVIFSGFGFTGALDKLGVERRVQTAGGNKNLLDPFLPEREEDKQIIAAILTDIHLLFRQAVEEGRGERLAADARIFDGTLFSGGDSIALGLVDGFGDIGSVSRDIIEVERYLYYREEDWLEELFEKLNTVLTPVAGVRAVSN